MIRKFISTLLSLALAATAVHSEAAQSIDTEFKDNARNRSLALRVRMPDGKGKVPLVIFSHGLGGSRDGGKLWGEHWAAHGYCVIHTQHPGSDIELLKTASGAPLQRLKQGANGQQLIARAEDIRFVLDEIARRQASGDPAYARVDLDRIAMTGHSFGAMTTLALANQRYPGTNRTLTDARIKAFIAFSPQATAAPGSRSDSSSDLYSDMKKPLFVITGTLDGDMLGNGASPDKRAAVFDLLPAGDKYRVVFNNGDHMVFGGGSTVESDKFLQIIDHRHARTDATTAAVIQEKTKSLTLQFLDAYLKNEPNAKAWLSRDAAQAIGSTGVLVQK
jgi:predicted dienelactone hydrolase